ncbi:MAG: TonB-dependent receptor [Bacteroides sp.]|jgi:hemoglobin/transferrin/lactoferrin receptor protein|nr:TonB-dependent receptor [Bacteroides sp.]
MRAFWLIFLLCLANVLSAQVITIKSQENNRPLEFVNIITPDLSQTTTTNAEGQAEIYEFTGAEVIHISLIGYNTLKTSYRELEGMEFRVSLIPSVFYLDQVVVSASRWSQASREVPLKVASISQGQVILHNPQTAADLLNLSGQVFIQKSQQGGGSPMIRGFAANRLLIAVDGVRMNNAIFRSGNLQNVISLDPFAIEQAEVVFGSGSVIYGSDAIGGVMSFYTLAPEHSTFEKTLVSGNVTTRFASANGEKTGHLNLNIGGKKWASLTSFSYTDFSDLRVGKNGPDDYLRDAYVIRQGQEDIVVPNEDPRLQQPTGYAQGSLMQKISYRPNGHWDLTYGFQCSGTTDFDRYDRLILFRNGEPRSAEWYYGPQVWMMNNLRLRNYRATRAYDQFTVIAAHQNFRESRHDRNFNEVILRNRVEKVSAYSLNLDLKKTLREGQTLFYGAEAILNDVHSEGTDKNILTQGETPGAPRYPMASWASYAAYLTWQRELSKKVSLQAGARYNQYLLEADFDTTFYPLPFTTARINKGALTSSAGIIFNPTEDWRIRAMASTGFRAPNVDDLGKVFDSEPGSVVVPNPKLKAEYAYNFELGFTRTCGETFEIDVFPFFTYLQNAMVRREATLNGLDSIPYDGVMSRVLSIQNAAFARVWGIQADFELLITPQLEWSSTFNYQKGVEELDNGELSPLRHASPWFGTTQLAWTGQKWTATLYAQFSGAVTYDNLAEEERGKPYLYALDTNGNPWSPAWHTLNFKMRYQLNHHFRVSGGIENITNQRYRPYSSGLAAPGTNFIVALEYQF